ncbi:MAG: DNA-binding response regulator [Desulfobacter sp.]|nr:MAG: DNA-binding response regulator [Desulfobacter sp.]
MDRARILIVEGDRCLAADLEDRLTAMEYEVCGNVASEKEALTAAERTRPDLAVMDVGIRRIEAGVSLARILDKRFAIPVIYLTAPMDDMTIGRVKQTAPMACLAKPFSPDDLKAAIEVSLFRKTRDLIQKKSLERLEEKMIYRSRKLYAEILERKKIETRLKRAVEELENANRALAAMVDTREIEIQAIRETIRSRLEQRVLPYISALEEEVAGREPETTTIGLLKGAVMKTVPIKKYSIPPFQDSLSPRELKIVDLIKEGKSTKQISRYMNISPGTVSAYRNKIRKKLGLINTKTNLRSFLAIGRVSA